MSSAAAHQLLADRILRDRGDGYTIVVDLAHWTWCSDLLDYGVACVGLSGIAMLRLENPTYETKLSEWLADFLGPLYPADAGSDVA